MPHLHLHIYNAQGDTLDEEGADYADLAVARRRALEGVRSMLSAEVMEGELNLKGRLDIVDGAGRVLETLLFTDAVRIVLP